MDDHTDDNDDSVMEVDLSENTANEVGDSEYEEIGSTCSSPRGAGSLPGSDEAEWKPDPSVPEGWLIREFMTRTGQKLEHIKSPDGVFFPGRRAAMEWMKEKEYSLDQIRLMQSRLKIRWIENHDSVPPGWKTRKSKIKTNGGMTEMEWFLSPTGKMYRGKKSILKAIQTEPGIFSEEEIRKFKTVPVPIKKFSAEYNWNDQDSTLPPGWRSAVINMNSFGKIVETIRYLAPDGRFCISRVDAIKHMIKDENLHAEDLTKMKDGLLADGWITSEELPDGWFMKPDSGRGKRKEAHYNYLASDMSYLRSTKAAVTHMLADTASYSQADIERLQAKSRVEGNKLRPDKYNWIEGNESVPEGWKLRIVHCSNGLDREFLLAPDGTSYSGRKQALEYLRKASNSNPDDIRRLESGCKVVWTEDDPTLPPSWKSRITDINAKTGKVTMQWFLNPEGKMFRGRKSALEFIQSSGGYTKQEIRKFKFVLPNNKKTNYTWNSQDSSVPEGWYTTIINMNSFGNMVRSKRFMAPDGRFCSSRDEAIKYMIKEGLYEDSEIEIMEAGYEDDMEQTEFKTEGWEINTSNEESPQKRYFSDSDSDFNSPLKKKIKREIFTDEKEPSVKIKKEVNSDDENNSDKEKFKVEISEDKDDKDFIPKLKITKIKQHSESTAMNKEGDLTVIKEEKDATTIKKEEPDAASTPIKKEPMDEQLCYRLKSGRLVSRSLLGSPTKAGTSSQSGSPVMAKDEGWVDDDTTVPSGWRTKEYVNKGGQKVKHVMSPDGTFFAGRKAALEHMETTDGHPSEDIELMQSGLKVIWNEDDPTLPRNWKSRITTIKSKSGGLPSNMYWFKSPSGKMFRGKKSALRFMESSKHCTLDDVRKFKSTQGTDKKFTKDYKWNMEDPSIPPGWKSTIIQMNSFGKIVPSKRFLAPDGRYCSNRIDAIRYIVKEGIYPEKDLEIMKEGLVQDGWLRDAKLPAGWYMKPRKDKGAEVTASYYYLSNTFHQFDSTKAAVRYMLSEPDLFTQQDINKLESKIFSEVKKLTPDKYIWKEDPKTLPLGWKYRTVMCSNGLERHFFLAPDGSSYSGRKQALEYMKKINSKLEDIKKMESMMQVQWIDDDPNIPKNWRTRWTEMKTKTGVIPMQWFLSPEGKMFRGKKSALEFIVSSGQYTKEDIRKLRCSGDNVGNKTGYEWESNDPSLPDGWKSTVISVNSFGKMVQSKRYLSPDGRFCSSRIDSLKYMFKEDIFKKEDVEHMKNSLLLEGWELDSMLPPGWLIKPDKHKEEEATFNYLSPDFQFMRSTRAAQTFMQNSDEYTDEDVKKLGQLIAEEKRKIRMDKYGPGSSNKSPANSRRPSECSSSSTSTSPRASFSAVLSVPNSNHFQSKESQELMNKLGDGVITGGCWEKHDLLPVGWTMQKLDDTDVIFRCCRTGGGGNHNQNQLFDSFENALEEMEASDLYSVDEVKNFKKMGDELKSICVQNSGKYEWNNVDPTIPSGWKSRVVEGKLRRNFFLCPADGSVFACRRSGLHHIINQKFPKEDVQIMREMLIHEGWKFANFLPTDWMIRKTEGTRDGVYDVDFWLMNVEGNVFRSTKTAIEFLTNSADYDQTDIEKITTELEKERRQARMLKYDWLEDDPSVPIGWRLRHVEGKSARRTFFLSKDGFQFACRRAAYQHMISEKYPEEELQEMREKLSHEGWKSDSLLPSKWLVRKCEGSTNGIFDVNYYYLSAKGEMFHSIKAVIAHMTKSELFDQEDINKIKTKLDQETRKNRPQKYDWQDDENLPPGWKYRSVVKAGIRTDYILTSEGDQYQSRRAAMEHLIKENTDSQTIFKMWTTLDTEGWITSEDRLPKGWRVRSKERLKDNWQFYFLSPQMEVFKSNKTVLDNISKNPKLYTKDDYNKMKQWIEDEQKARREENYTWQQEKNLPPGWKVRAVITNSRNVREFFLTPDGDQIAGRKKAIEIMKENGASKSLIDAQTRKMKQISQKNSSKVGPEDFDLEGDSENGGRSADQNAKECRVPTEYESNIVDESRDFFSDEDETEFEDMQMMEDDDENPHEISLEGMVPEFEPVEITPDQSFDHSTVDQSRDYSTADDDVMSDEGDFEDDEEFNDVEEITDVPEEVFDEDNMKAENIKVEPDIFF